MSTKKKPAPTLLGPDGRPIDRERYAKKPEPIAPVRVADNPFIITYESLMGTAQRYLFGSTGTSTPQTGPALGERVARDLEALTSHLPFQAGAELPRPEPDLTTYADALASAVKKCPHGNVHETMYAYREGQCQDCGRYVHYKSGGMFGGSWE